MILANLGQVGVPLDPNNSITMEAADRGPLVVSATSHWPNDTSVSQRSLSHTKRQALDDTPGCIASIWVDTSHKCRERERAATPEDQTMGSSNSFSSPSSFDHSITPSKKPRNGHARAV